jgi:malate dehydrogenase (oxaloacetate-decarboxylating)
VAQEHDLDPAFPLHRGGKIEVRPAVRIRDPEGLALAYTPGVARVSQAIAADPELAYDYTWKSNTVLIVTDGTAVLGLGDIGPLAALPVMRASHCSSRSSQAWMPFHLPGHHGRRGDHRHCRIAPAYGGVNLEDISAPRCFEIERRLADSLDIPVFHDDQHGTAIVVLAALKNAALLTGRAEADLKVVISGAGAAGTAVASILVADGVRNVMVGDSRGILSPERGDLNDAKSNLLLATNPTGFHGSVEEALDGADVDRGIRRHDR